MTQASLDAPAYSPWGIAFYSMFVATIIAFVVINLALNNLIGLFYSGLFAGFLATLWALEGGLTAVGFSGVNADETFAAIERGARDAIADFGYGALARTFGAIVAGDATVSDIDADPGGLLETPASALDVV